jgi:hypothetical protein
MSSNSWPWSGVVRRLRGKSVSQLARAAATRAWPLSIGVRAYYRRHFGARVDGRRNATLRAAHGRAADGRVLDSVQRRVVEELRSEGVCVTSVDELFGDPGLLPRLREEARRLLDQTAVREAVNGHATRLGRRWGSKWYVVRAMGWSRRLRLTPPLQELFVHPRLLAVVNEYLGFYSRLTYADLWYNIPADPNDPQVASERWHRDQEDRRVVKMYLYVEDVDETMGPLHYLRRTQEGAQYGQEFPPAYPNGSYPPDGELARAVPAEMAKRCTGPAGTIVLCDTFGFHKGGRSTTRPRVLFTSVYASNLVLDYVRYDPADGTDGLPEAASFALRRR